MQAEPKKMHPGVSLWQKVAGGTYYAMFRDPRNEKQKRPTLETSDQLVAHERARVISTIRATPAWWENPPRTLDAVARKAWGASDRTAQIVDAFQDLKSSTNEANVDKFMSVALRRDPKKKRVFEGHKGPWKFENLAQRLADAHADLDTKVQRIAVLEAILKRMGVKVTADMQPRPMTQAVNDYLASPTGSNASPRYKKIVRFWLEKYAKHVGDSQNVLDVEPQNLVDYLAGLLSTNSSGNVRQQTDQICKFMRFANSAFDEKEVKGVMKPRLKKHTDDKESPDWYWLSNAQALALIEAMKLQWGQYWADAATLQYACGVRPEELVLIQTKNCILKGQAKIKLRKLVQDGKVVRRLKTARSEDEIQVPAFALPALKRRIKKKGFLLFPLNEESGAVVSDCENADEKALKLWPIDDCEFSKAYLRRLKNSATKANELESLKLKIELEKLDSRTFRRTCAREMILKYGFDHAAAVLRDSVETLRKHYADLRAIDISTER